MAFSPDKRTLAVSTSDGRINFWDWTTGKERGKLVLPQVQAGVLAYSPDGKVLASCTGSWPWAGTERDVRLWDVKTGRLLRLLRGHQGTVRDLAFAPGGRLLASAGGEDKTVRVWAVATGKELLKLEGHTGGVLCVAYSPDGKTLASGSADTTVLLWDVRGVHPPEPAGAPSPAHKRRSGSPKSLRAFGVR
jgi:WD40 repeat protein